MVGTLWGPPYNVGHRNKEPMSAMKKESTRSRPASSETRAAPRAHSVGKFPIVAVGASAGGLEAFTSVLRALPPDPGIALIFIPHLDPTHESAMVELLSRTTRLPVLQAAEGMRVAANCVYVLPPNCDMSIAGGVLHLVKRIAERGHHMPIDSFMRSLAEDQTTSAVGVILSGMANDGTLGLAAIKNEGGLTFAQDSDSAKYDSMPASAVHAGVVDFSLPPDRIAKHLLRVREMPLQQDADSDVFHKRDDQLKEIFRLLRGHSKVDFADYKTATIRRRILRRMNITQTDDLADYVRVLQTNPPEVEALYRDVLINVTSFFRNAFVFESLREHVYEKILRQRATSEPVRIWVPGCSTGEETYSHAISIVETLSELRIEVPVQIFGTDLSETAIQKARTGVYRESIVSDVSEIRLRRFFQKTPGGYQISKPLRDMCIFARQNVFSDPPFSHMDLISCRNVLIYLSPVLQKRVIPIFHYALKPDGYLVVGNSEGLLGAGAAIFNLIERKSKIYQKKDVPSPVTFGLALRGQETLKRDREKPMHPSKENEPVKTPVDVQREADRLLLAKYVPSAVVLNQDLEILQSRGRTGRFLELPAGKASLNLLKMAKPGLMYELRDLIEKARKDGVPAAKDHIMVEEDGRQPVRVRVEVVPFATPARDQKNFLVLFEEETGQEQDRAEKRSTRPAGTRDQRATQQQMEQLKQELGATKEYLQSIIESQEATNEELQSANEEIQSGNEELQSTNEELQTSKEELESANEELNTVNEEIQSRNQQLARLSNDLTNLLNSATIPMIMLGQDLRIRRYTPEAEKALGFSESDVGKTLTHIPLAIDLPLLERWMLDVIRDVTAHSEQVRAHDGKWYKLRITPYRTLENNIDGVVITLLDISDVVEREMGGKDSRSKRA